MVTAANWWFLAFAAATLLTPPIALGFAGGTPHAAMALGLAGIWVGVARRQDWRISFRPPAAAMLATVAVFTASCGLALLYSGPKVAAGSLARALLFGLAIYTFLYFRDGPGAKSDPGPILKWMLGCAALSAWFGCLDFVFQWDPLAPFADQFAWEFRLRRAQGLFYEAGHFGNFCAFFLVGAAALWTQRGRPFLSPVLATFLAPALLAGLVFSFSRSAVLNLAVGLLTFVALSFRRNGGARLLWALVLGAALGWALFAWAPTVAGHAADRLAGTVAQAFADPTVLLGERLEAWKLILAFLVDHPWHLAFGLGFKTLPHSEVIGQRVVADNTFVSVLAETGIVGVMAVGCMLAGILRTSYRSSLSADPTTATLGLWSFAFWVGQLVQMCLVDSLTYWRVLPLYLVVLALAARDEDSRPRPVR